VVRELSELLADSVDARARSVAGLTPDADDYATMVRTVRRRRVVRRSLQTLAVVPLVGGLAAGAYFGLGSLRAPDTEPAVTPTDYVTHPPRTLAPLVKGDLVSEVGLPPFYEAPANLWAHVDSGWVAMTYRPEYVGADGESSGTLSNALFVADPDGELFRVAELPLPLEIQVLSWEVGQQRVRVMWPTPIDDAARPLVTGWVDVRTGELTEDAQQFERWASYVGRDADGAEIWVEDPAYEEDVVAGGSGGATVWSIGPDGARRVVTDIGDRGVPLLDPSGTQLLAPGAEPARELVVVDLGSGDARDVPLGVSDQVCAVVGWLDAGGVAALCHDPVSDDAEAALDRVDYVAQNAGLYRVEAVADGGTTLLHAFAEGEPVPLPWTGVNAGDGAVLYVVGDGFPEGCTRGFGAWDGVAVRTVQGAHPDGANVHWSRPGVVGGPALAVSSASCEAGDAQATVATIDPATGAARILTPMLEPNGPAGIDRWRASVTSAAAATPRG